ncbi:FG-GAP repeat protein [Roseiflexus sp. RS-1]|jgi:hypothetical protein|uniref:FG-GAP repeat protein n=1 Tax=Roseiflexus sp. (strain RS-1) TaxID=357808 RepID=UPI0000D7FBB3|nr:FG-GAP repeat protein [Roseiflexus sp. RS-1]ABQ92952.1 Integrin alpha beta-propellor repeat protein [Roseiflexus sp. RS-1]
MRSWKRLSAPVAGVVLITLLTLFAPARSVMMQSSLTFTQTKLLAADAAQYNYFGLSVAVRGDTAIVGAYGKSDLVRNAGAAYAFTRNAGSWTQQARLGTSSPLIDAYLGATVATNGSYTAAGAPYASVGAQNDGVVYLFSNATWQQQTILLPNDPDSLSQFGNALAINDNTLFVGAPMHDSFGVNAGAVYVFTFDGASWVQQQKLIGVDTAPGDRFGSALALNDGWLAVSAPLHSSPGSPGGAVYLFEFDGVSWVQRYKVGAPDTIAGDRFGSAIALDDGWLAVGVPLHRFVGSASGAVYLFEFNGTAWVQRQKFVASDTAGSDQFGSALALENRRLVVGAPLHNSNGPASGAVYIFERATTTWIERAKLIGSDTNAGDRLGGSISIDGNTILVGAYGDTAAGPATGAAYVFVEVTGPGVTTTPSIIVTPTETSTPSATPSNTPSPTFTSTPSATPSNTPSPTFTSTPSPTPSATPTFTSTPSPTPSATPTFTSTPSPTPSATPTFTSTPSPTPSATPTFTSTPSPTPSATPTFTSTPSPTPSATPTFTSTPSPTPSATPTFTSTPSPTPSATPTFTSTPLPTPSATPTFTSTPSPTPSATPTFTSTPSPTPSATPSNTPSATPSNTPTATATVPPGTGTPRPILACVARRSPASYVAIFGYEMEGTAPVHMPVGGENRFNRYREDLGQPTTFEPGTRRAAFAVVFDGLPLTWSLAGRQVTAWANYPIRCSSDAVVRIQPILECTLPDSNGTTIARFGYRNDNAFNVAVPVRWQNFFVPAPIQRGQPVVFAPGRHRFVFETGFSRGALVWFLDGRIAVATNAPVQACQFN